jgi:hypothetical protein
LKSRGQLAPFVGNPAWIKKRNVTRFEQYSKLDFFKDRQKCQKKENIGLLLSKFGGQIAHFSDIRLQEY